MGRFRVSDSQDAPSTDIFETRIVRSKRRKKTASARMLNWYTVEIRVPAHINDQVLQRVVQHFEEKLRDERDRWRNFATDGELEERAQRLNESFFDGALRWRSIRFVSNQNKCFGSCSPMRGTIRLSHRLAHVPSFVLDYVLMHELTHLLEPTHSEAFWEQVYRYKRTERARGYLMAMHLEEDAVQPQKEDEITEAREDEGDES
jgi:hypothetical protein